MITCIVEGYFKYNALLHVQCITDGNFITYVLDRNFITDEFSITRYYMFYKRLKLVFHLGIVLVYFT